MMKLSLLCGKTGIRGLGLLSALIPLSSHAQQPMSLSDAVSKALANRGSVRAAEDKLAAARASERAMGANPPARLEFGYSTRPDLGIGNDMFLAVPIDIFGKTRGQRSSGRAAVLSAQATLRQTQIDLQAEVMTSFATVQSAEALVETGQDLAGIAQKAYDATKARIAAGDLPPAQLLKADLELRRANQTLGLRKAGLDSALKRFAASVGVAVETIGIIDGTLPNLPDVSNPDRRPDIEQIRSELVSARADSEIAGSSRWPDFELEFARDFWDTPARYVGRVQFVLPLYDYGASREKQRAARSGEDAARHALSDRIATARLEIESARIDMNAAKQASQGFDKLMEDAKALLVKEEGAFASGASTLLDVLDASRALREIEESAIDARQQWILAEGKYLTATGVLLVGSNLPQVRK